MASSNTRPGSGGTPHGGSEGNQQQGGTPGSNPFAPSNTPTSNPFAPRNTTQQAATTQATNFTNPFAPTTNPSTSGAGALGTTPITSGAGNPDIFLSPQPLPSQYGPPAPGSSNVQPTNNTQQRPPLSTPISAAQNTPRAQIQSTTTAPPRGTPAILAPAQAQKASPWTQNMPAQPTGAQVQNNAVQTPQNTQAQAQRTSGGPAQATPSAVQSTPAQTQSVPVAPPSVLQPVVNQLADRDRCNAFVGYLFDADEQRYFASHLYYRDLKTIKRDEPLVDQTANPPEKWEIYRGKPSQKGGTKRPLAEEDATASAAKRHAVVTSASGKVPGKMLDAVVDLTTSDDDDDDHGDVATSDTVQTNDPDRGPRGYSPSNPKFRYHLPDEMKGQWPGPHVGLRIDLTKFRGDHNWPDGDIRETFDLEFRSAGANLYNCPSTDQDVGLSKDAEDDGWQLGKRDPQTGAPVKCELIKGLPLVEDVVFVKHDNYNGRRGIPNGVCYWAALATILYGDPGFWLRVKAEHLEHFAQVLESKKNPRHAYYKQLNEAWHETIASPGKQHDGAKKRFGSRLNLNMWQILSLPNVYVPIDMVDVTADLYGLYLIVYSYNHPADEAKQGKVYDLRARGAYNARHVGLIFANDNHFQPIVPNEYIHWEFKFPRMTKEATRGIFDAAEDGWREKWDKRKDGVRHPWRSESGGQRAPLIIDHGFDTEVGEMTVSYRHDHQDEDDGDNPSKGRSDSGDGGAGENDAENDAGNDNEGHAGMGNSGRGTPNVQLGVVKNASQFAEQVFDSCFPGAGGADPISNSAPHNLCGLYALRDSLTYQVFSGEENRTPTVNHLQSIADGLNAILDPETVQAIGANGNYTVEQLALTLKGFGLEKNRKLRLGTVYVMYGKENYILLLDQTDPDDLAGLEIVWIFNRRSDQGRTGKYRYHWEGLRAAKPSKKEEDNDEGEDSNEDEDDNGGEDGNSGEDDNGGGENDDDGDGDDHDGGDNNDGEDYSSSGFEYEHDGDYDRDFDPLNDSTKYTADDVRHESEENHEDDIIEEEEVIKEEADDQDEEERRSDPDTSSSLSDPPPSDDEEERESRGRQTLRRDHSDPDSSSPSSSSDEDEDDDNNNNGKEPPGMVAYYMTELHDLPPDPPGGTDWDALSSDTDEDDVEMEEPDQNAGPVEEETDKHFTEQEKEMERLEGEEHGELEKVVPGTSGELPPRQTSPKIPISDAPPVPHNDHPPPPPHDEQKTAVAVSKDASTRRPRILKLRAQLKKVRAQRKTYREERDAMEQERNAMEQERNAMEQERNAMEQERNAMEQERNDAVAQHIVFQNLNATYLLQLRNVQEENEGNKKRLDDALQGRVDFQKKNVELNKNLANSQAENEQLRERIQELEREVERLRQEREAQPPEESDEEEAEPKPIKKPGSTKLCKHPCAGGKLTKQGKKCTHNCRGCHPEKEDAEEGGEESAAQPSPPPATGVRKSERANKGKRKRTV